MLGSRKCMAGLWSATSCHGERGDSGSCRADSLQTQQGFPRSPWTRLATASHMDCEYHTQCGRPVFLQQLQAGKPMGDWDLQTQPCVACRLIQG